MTSMNKVRSIWKGLLLVFMRYRKIPIINPAGRMFVQKAFLVGLFSGELIFGGFIIGGTFPFQTRHEDNSPAKKCNVKQLP